MNNDNNKEIHINNINNKNNENISDIINNDNEVIKNNSFVNENENNYNNFNQNNIIDNENVNKMNIDDGKNKQNFLHENHSFHVPTHLFLFYNTSLYFFHAIL